VIDSPEIAGPVASAAELRRSPLSKWHRAHGAHLVPFAGWEMPLYFSSILEEHDAVRTGVGLFDVSHMGIFTVEGASAAALLTRRTTADVARLVPGQCRYTFWLDSTGVILDDLLLTRLDPGARGPPSFLVVPNAGRADRIEELLLQHRKPDTDVRRHNGEVAILAVQGPRSRDLLESVFGWALAALKPYTGRRFPIGAGSDASPNGTLGTAIPADLRDAAFVSRTGYTGELGFELFVAASRAAALADRMESAGAVPCGLGARDTLRLEKGYLLSGQDFLIDRTPLEAGQERFVDFDHAFVGRDALEKQRVEGPRLRLAGLVVETPGAIPRHGTPVLHGGTAVSAVTSGGLSPSLKRGIALAYLPRPLFEPGTEVELDLRGRRVPGRVVPLPFVPSVRPAATAAASGD
jgi:aminomethyltransferase